MNHVVNDLGQTVLAVGEAGSIERARCEYPALIGELTEICTAERTTSGLGEVDSACVIAERLLARGVYAEADAKALVLASGFSEDNFREIFGQLRLLNEDHDRELRSSIPPVLPKPNTQNLKAFTL